MNYRKIVPLLPLPLLLVSCSDDETVSNPIYFQVADMGTRGVIDKTTEVAPGFWITASNEKGTYIDEFARYNGQVQLTDTYTWPEGEQTFVAFKYGDAMLPSNPFESDGGIKFLNIDGITDYVCAYKKLSEKESDHGTVTLEFQHIMAYAQLYYRMEGEDTDTKRYSIVECYLSGKGHGTFYPSSLAKERTAWDFTLDAPNQERNESKNFYFFKEGNSFGEVPYSDTATLLQVGTKGPYELSLIPGEYTMTVRYTLEEGAPYEIGGKNAETRGAKTTTTPFTKTGRVTLKQGHVNALIITLSGSEVPGGNDNNDPSAPDNPEAD